MLFKCIFGKMQSKSGRNFGGFDRKRLLKARIAAVTGIDMHLYAKRGRFLRIDRADC